jgi:Tol biopolymer transport system component
MFRLVTSSLAVVGVLVALTCSAAMPQSDVQRRVQDKVKQVETTFPKWVQAGGNPRTLEPLTEQLDRHMKAGRLAEGEKILDQILTILRNEKPAPAAASNETVVQRVQRKAKEFDSKAPLWVAGGGDPNRIRPIAERLDVQLKAGRPTEAEPILDELLAIVNEAPSAPRATGEPVSLAPKRVRLSRIPDSAKIVFHANELIYVMDATGGNITQITFDRGRHFEHVAVSHDRRRIVANYFANPAQGHQSSRLVLFDLEAGTEQALVPQFRMAGNGGVDWDPAGNIYFAGVERSPFERPSGREQFIANAAANDVYRVRYDGSDLRRLTRTDDRGEADVSVAADGKRIAYMATYINPPNDYTEVWVNSSDGGSPRLVYKGGKMGVESVHDPELSPDGTEVIFSKVNPDHKNFRSDPNANTAHDLYRVRLDGSGLGRVTQPGPISVIPDWVGNQVLFLLLTDRESTPFRGVALMNSDGSGLRRINPRANIAKWIPDGR